MDLILTTSFFNHLFLANGLIPSFSPQSNLPLEKAKASTATTKVYGYLTQFMFHLRAIDFERQIYYGGEDN